MALVDRIQRRSVGLVTIISHGNYGNRLQNYAMQRIITDLGFRLHHDPQLADVGRGSGQSKSASPQALTGAGAHAADRAPEPAAALHGCRRTRARSTPGACRARRTPRPRLHPRPYPRNRLHDLSRHARPAHLDAMYDYFVVGSDQVWNPELPEARRGRFPDLRRQARSGSPSRRAWASRTSPKSTAPSTRAAERFRAHLRARGSGRRDGARR